MRLLIIHDHAPEALAIERACAGLAQLKTFHGLADAVHDLTRTSWRPDAAVVDLRPGPPGDQALARLRELLGAVPLILGAAGALGFVEARLRSEARDGGLRPDLGGMIELLVEQQRHLAQAVLGHRPSGQVDVERIATHAAEVAVGKAVDQLTQRLGLEDAEGLRLAIRFARAWDAAKLKFLSTVTTGMAAAFLLALGAGIVTVVDRQPPQLAH